MCVNDEYEIKMINGKINGVWSRHQSFIFGVIVTLKLVYETRVWIQGLIMHREDISTLQHPFNEWLPIHLPSLLILSQLLYLFVYFIFYF